MVHVFLGLLDHLHSLVPLLLEVDLGLLNVLLLDLDPSIDSFVLGFVSPWRVELLIKELLELLSLFLLLEPDDLLPELDEL